MTVPEKILDRFEEAREDDYEELGVEIALEIIEKIKDKQGINGIPPDVGGLGSHCTPPH